MTDTADRIAQLIYYDLQNEAAIAARIRPMVERMEHHRGNRAAAQPSPDAYAIAHALRETGAEKYGIKERNYDAYHEDRGEPCAEPSDDALARRPQAEPSEPCPHCGAAHCVRSHVGLDSPQAEPMK